MTTLERFYTFVQKTETCWLWTGALDKDGYARFWWGGRTGRASRYILTALFGIVLSKTTVVRYTCDNTRCVNPTHLVHGTQAENIQDCWRKRRASLNARPMRGTSNGNHKLTGAQVLLIRARYKPGVAPIPSENSLRNLAKEFGVSKYAIQCVVRGVTWRHLLDSVTVVR